MPACSSESTTSNCTAEDKAQVRQVKGKGVRVLDFTNSSTACLDDFANKVSQRDLVLVAESNSQAWRDATVVAARMLQDEGKVVGVAYANDTDGRDNTAATVAWANGVKRDITSVSMKNGLTIDQLHTSKAVSYIYSKGEQVWDRHLKLPKRDKP